MSLKKLQFKSVKTRLVFLFSIVALVPLITVSFIEYRQRVLSIKNQQFTKLAAIRDLKVDQINNWLDERTGDIRTISEDYETREVTEAFYKQKEIQVDKKKATRARTLMERYIRNYESFYETFIIDAASGKIVVSSRPDIEGKDKSGDRYFTVPLRTGGVYIKDIYYSKTENRTAMTFSCPIFSIPDKNRIVGIAVARINLERSLYDLLLHRTGLGKTGETLIVNKNGMALNELRWHQHAPLQLKIEAEPALSAARGGTGIVETTDYREVKVLAAYAHIPRTGWGFVAKQDQQEVYAPIAKIFNHLLVILAIFALLIILIAVFTANSIAGPILEMINVSKKIHEGDFSARNNIQQADEFGFLGQVFNDMTGSIQSKIFIQQKSAQLTGVMVESETLEDFSWNILETLLEITGSNFGVFFIYDENKKKFIPLHSIGAHLELIESFKADMFEGDIGAALAAGKIRHIKDIPADTVFKIKTFIGTALPKEILIIPILVDNTARAFISLASLTKYSRECLEIANNTWLSLNTALSNLMANIKTAKMAEDLKEKNREITTINRELMDQAEELKIQQLQLADANRLKSEFLSNMSHELRTPLNSILALSQLMIAKGTGKNPGKELENLEIIERNGRILLNLINDILDLTKIESGRMELNLTEFKPEPVTLTSLEIIKPVAEARGLNLKVNLVDNPTIYSDRDRVQQVLSNLLSNAVKFTEKGEIELTVTSAAGQVFFAVRDTGIGIKREDLPYIFTEFRQVDGSTSRQYGGTGLGLAISQKFAGFLGGKITVDSEPGKGSTFTLVLPLRIRFSGDEKAGPPVLESPRESDEPPDSPPQPPVDFTGAFAAPGEPPRILVIEDNDVAVMQIRSALEENGFAVTTASNGREGLESIDKTLPDAVILDLMMPKVSGFQVLEQIRSNPATSGLPVLILTAKELTREELANLELNNVRQLIRKGSLDRDQLTARVKDLISRPAPLKQSQPTSTSISTSTSGASRLILVVEDNPDNLYLITAILEEADYKYITAENGKEAVNKAKESFPGLILMDIQLPILSGLDAAGQIKAEPRLAHIPIIALTAKAMKGDKEQILSAGCNDYISKPIDAETLLKTMEKWMSG
jgi:signal transduction histidine kinase/CheY-like chemotaxis protein/HAMP domain-containing protein